MPFHTKWKLFSLKKPFFFKFTLQWLYSPDGKEYDSDVP